ncbi:MAG TPA: alpha/beta hydrolase [Brevibacillus sp.]|nr:alpha/beta hydrolase [Brevibacillus sp.]
MLYCRYSLRQDAPAVIFIAGLGDSCETWDKVQARIAQMASTFSHDRAGIGKSEAAAKVPRTCADLVEELCELIAQTPVKPPYILVGHSFGGLVARLFASRFPKLVAGMVLVDAAAEYKELAYEKVLPAALIAENRAYLENPLLNREQIDKPQSYRQVSAHTGVSRMPLAILMRGRPDYAQNDWPHEEILQIEQQLQADFQRLSTASRIKVAKDSGHDIHHDDPDLVAEEITIIVNEVRKMSEIKQQFVRDMERIAANQYQLDAGEKPGDFVELMLQYIGDPDPQLRDESIYPTFYAWIHRENKFTEGELRRLLLVLTDEQHLFYQIGSAGDDSVFTRTFSVLPIALILGQHRKQPFLDQTDFEHVKRALLRYYRGERDLRGYVPEGGWAHSAAHGADALDELIQCPESDEALQLEVLDAIAGMLHNGAHIFCEEEDERMATIVHMMLGKELLPIEQIADWINSLAECGNWPRSRSQRIAQVNSKQFLRALFFRKTGPQGCDQRVASAIVGAEAKLNRFAE